MRYIDTGSRDPSQALGSWLATELTPSIVEVRWQTGFFSAEVLGLLDPTLRRLASANRPVKALIGSNTGLTFRDDILKLVELVDIPRSEATLGIVSYAGGFFHPKTYHLRRQDGSQCAYVGSANLTGLGASLHIEAGILLDSAEGDSESILSRIADVIDEWFALQRDGLSIIRGAGDVQDLATAGILATVPPPRITRVTTGTGSGVSTRTRLSPLLALPGLTVVTSPDEAPEEAELPTTIVSPSATRPEFPEYMLFAPNANEPTQGASALSGVTLPGGVGGLVIRLNRDSARHFEGRSGTANMSIPVATVGTLRFGIFRGTHARPRAEYDMKIRYVGERNTIHAPDATTNVMAYGVAPGETGHRDIRMLMPAGVDALAQGIIRAGLPVPEDGDVALLEWPSPVEPAFRLTFMQRGSPLFELADRLLQDAVTRNQTVGRGACWLPVGVSPGW